MQSDTQMWVVYLFNIPSSVSHQLWTWDFLWLIMYYRSPCSFLIFLTLNHILWLRSILHPFIWVSSWLHLSPWRSSFVIMPSLKTFSPCFTSYYLLWYKQPMPCKSFLYYQNLFIQHHIPIRGFCKPFIFLSIFKIFLCFFSITYWFASKFNCRCKYRVTIQFILFHNHLSLESINHYVVFMASTA
jgi:hypothetical protein